ncbi:MAG: hypothetical protein WBC44_07330 [Planctomycetaceae bacterium]
MDDHDDFNAGFTDRLDDDSARNRRLFFWLLAGMTAAGAVGIALCVGVVWLALERFGEIPVLGDFAMAEMPPPVHETPEERRAWVQAAFADPPPFAVDRRPIDTVFRQIAEACQADDAAAFRQLIDAESCWRSMKESGLIRSLTRGDDRSYAEQVVAAIEVPAPYERFHIQAVMPGRNPDEVVAYVFAWEEAWISEMRWWLVKRGSSWRVSDWESLQIGNRFSRRNAAYVAEVAGINGHEASVNAVAKADEAIGENRRRDAARELHKAAAAKVPQLFEAEHTLDIAFGWARAGLTLYEHRVYRAASDDHLQRAPGLLLGWAMTESSAGNFEKCLELIDRYENAVGGGPNVDRTRGDALFALGRFEEAADAYVRLLDDQPDEISLLSDLARRLPPERFDALTSAIRKQSDPLVASLTVAASVADRPKALAAIEAVLNESHPESGELFLIRGDRLKAEGAIDDAATAYLAAYDRLPPFDEDSDEPPPAIRDDAVSRLVMMFCEEDRAADAYDRAPDKQQAFEEITYYDDEYGLEPGRMDEVAARHLAVNPEDPAALVYAALAAAQEDDADRAVELLKQAAAQESEFSYGYQIVPVLVDAGRLDEAQTWVREHPDDVYAFDTLAEHLNEAGEWTTVLEIADALKGDEENGQLTIAVQKAKALAALDRYGEAESLLEATFRQLDEEWQRPNLLDRWYEIATAAGRPPERIAARIGEEAFRQFTLSAVHERDYETAKRLERSWKLHGGTAIDLLPSTVARLWQQNDHEAIVTAVRGARVENAASTESGPVLLEQYVRSLIRLNRTDDARQAALPAYESTADATLYAVACVAAKDWDAAAEAVRALDDYGRSGLFADDDAGPVIEDAAAFRKTLRREVGDLAGATRGVLLLHDPIETDVDELAHRLEEHFGDERNVQIEPIELESNANESHLLIRDGGASWIVTFGRDSYLSERATADPASEVLALAIDEHAGWVAVDECAGSRHDRPVAYPIVAAVADVVADAEPVAVQLHSDAGAHLIPWSEELPELLIAEDVVPSNLAGAELWWLFRETADEEPPRGLEWSLRELASSFARRKPDDEFTVEGLVSFPHGRLPIRLDVEQVVVYPYMTEAAGALVSELPDGFAEAIGLHADDRVTLSGWNLRDWRGPGRPDQQAAPTDE